jgi:hypothetical protein
MKGLYFVTHMNWDVLFRSTRPCSDGLRIRERPTEETITKGTEAIQKAAEVLVAAGRIIPLPHPLQTWEWMRE